MALTRRWRWLGYRAPLSADPAQRDHGPPRSVRVQNARHGFFERAEVEPILVHLADLLDDVTRFG